MVDAGVVGKTAMLFIVCAVLLFVVWLCGIANRPGGPAAGHNGEGLKTHDESIYQDQAGHVDRTDSLPWHGTCVGQ